MEATTNQQRVILTGATGVLGRALVDAFDHSELVCLTHERPLDAARVTQVRGDITQADLGLDRSSYEVLCDDVRAVVHCAAATNFTAPSAEIERTNVTGTQNVARLAKAAEAPLYQVSTAFVHPATREAADPDSAAGADSDHAEPGPGTYVESKADAEQIVDGEPLPSVIFRPSILIGDTDSGEISEFQGLQVLAGYLLKGRLPLLPASPEARVDFLPRDYVARLIAAVVDAGAPVERSEELWLTAGDSALGLEQMVEQCLDLAEPLTGRTPKRPRIVDPEIVDRLIRPGLMSELPEKVARQLELLFQLLPLVNTEAPFPSSVDELRARYDVGPPPDLREAFRRSLEYWADETGVKPKERAA